MWMLWTTRNNMIFREKLVYSLLMLSFQIISLLQQWKVLSVKDDVKIDKLTENLVGAISIPGTPGTGIG